MEKNKGRQVLALERAIRILEFIADAEEPKPLNEICRSLDLSKSGAFYILDTLKSHGYLEKDEMDRYSIGIRSFLVGNKYSKSNTLITTFKEVANGIVAKCGETVNLAILEGTQVIYTAKVDGTHPVRLASYVGRVLPAHATAMGKVLLAFLPQNQRGELLANENKLVKLSKNTITSKNKLIKELNEVRSQGYAFDNEETANSLFCVAAPIFGDARAEAAISISALTNRVEASVGAKQKLIDLVVQGANDISLVTSGRTFETGDIIEA